VDSTWLALRFEKVAQVVCGWLKWFFTLPKARALMSDTDSPRESLGNGLKSVVIYTLLAARQVLRGRTVSLQKPQQQRTGQQLGNALVTQVSRRIWTNPSSGKIIPVDGMARTTFRPAEKSVPVVVGEPSATVFHCFASLAARAAIRDILQSSS